MTTVSAAPDRFVSICEVCRKSLDTREDGVHQFISGWVKNRSDGGAHGVSLPKRENRWRCARCISDETQGVLGQIVLL